MTALLAIDPIPGDGDSNKAPHLYALRDLVSGLSMEVAPGLAHEARIAECLPDGTHAFIPWLPGARSDEAVDAAVKLRKHGLIPVPHLAARRMRDRASLDDVLGRLKGEAGVDQLLVIGGDVATPDGEFTSALEFLETDVLPSHGIMRVGVGGYPEGHPYISNNALLDALLHKQDHAARAGIDMFVVTQFAFSAAPVVSWLEQARAAGLRLPIHVGVPGPARVGTLLRYSKMCGIGPSMKMLLRHGKGLTSVARVSRPSRMVLDLAEYRAAHPDCGMGPLHIYPFGGVARAVAWLDSLTPKDR